MNYFLVSLADPIDMLHHIQHLQSPLVAVDNYKKDVYEAFTKQIVSPICQTTEEELRGQIHRILIPNMAQMNPTKDRTPNISRYARMNDLYLFEK